MSFDQELRRFPAKIELSYETVSHKKVSDHYKICLAIPQSKKYFAWFTRNAMTNDNICLLHELNREKKISTTMSIKSTINGIVPTNTLLYGSFLDNVFIIEDILQYGGEFLQKTAFIDKLVLYKKILFHGEMTSGTGTAINVEFGIPVMWLVDEITQYQDILKSVKYPIHHIQYRVLDNIAPFLNVQLNQRQNAPCWTDTPLVSKPKSVQIRISYREWMNIEHPQYKMTTIFHVMADAQNDIYHLYAQDIHKRIKVYYDIAYISNCKMSVFMNGIFRKIKENVSLDAIEESDDEDDFQDMNPTKYVDLAKTVNMECKWNPKFKRWMPLRVVENNKVVSIYSL